VVLKLLPLLRPHHHHHHRFEQQQKMKQKLQSESKVEQYFSVEN